jgi:hypothetical protein
MCRDATSSSPGQAQRAKWRNAALVAGSVMGSAAAVSRPPCDQKKYEVQCETECL